MHFIFWLTFGFSFWAGEASSITEHFQLLEVSVSEEVNLEAALIFAGTKRQGGILPTLLSRTSLERLFDSDGTRGRCLVYRLRAPGLSVSNEANLCSAFIHSASE